ncbi:unnamed protein product [Lactuca virosa]|uniref:Uncharacterized protein n=1 Tax=Lactuca virosa TaxID=75947 RepID=A0AAU9MLY6_9ASTR|nr:unnamed protein product [Lactuca virosa]
MTNERDNRTVSGSTVPKDDLENAEHPWRSRDNDGGRRKDSEREGEPIKAVRISLGEENEAVKGWISAFSSIPIFISTFFSDSNRDLFPSFLAFLCN